MSHFVIKSKKYLCLIFSGNVAQGNHKGITSPISLSGPSAKDEELSQKLEESMKPHGVFEDEDELAKR